jgi:hypothetical protein
MNIYLEKPGIGMTELSSGDEIGVYDGEICVGAAVINAEPERFVILTASYDDQMTTTKDGFDEGNAISLRFWNSETGEEKKIEPVEVIKGSEMAFKRMGTLVLRTEFKVTGDYYLGNAWPNPSKDMTMFTFGLSEPGKVRLEIFDHSGSLVKILVNKELPAGSYEIEWNNSTDLDTRVLPGVYYYRLSVNSFSQTNTLIIQ